MLKSYFPLPGREEVQPGEIQAVGKIILNIHFIQLSYFVMKDLICPFGATQAKEDFACRHAEKIIRRGGAEFACNSADTHVECSQLLRCLKDVALPEFGVEDDPTQMPYSTLVKIQFGGLLGLQRITAATESTANGIADIASLIDAAKARFASIDAVPCESLCADITNYKLSRRRSR
jgi:hypothetical protein